MNASLEASCQFSEVSATLMPMATVFPAGLDDPTFYPIEEKVGEDSLQRFIAELLRGSIDYFLRGRGEPTFVGADQFVYWVKHRPQKVVAPDVYVLPGVEREARIPCLKTWESGIVPSFVLEIVSPNSVDKDYREAPTRYEELGVEELVIFDPDYRRGRDRLRFQVYRKLRSGFEQVAASNVDRVHSRVLGCWIRAVGHGERVRLRLATGERGGMIVPTEIEAESARAAAESARAAAESARADAEQRRAEQAEAQLKQLRAELGRAKKK